MKTPMSSLFQYKIKTFWKQQTKQQTATACIFALIFTGLGGGAWPPRHPPWIRYWHSSVCAMKYLSTIHNYAFRFAHAAKKDHEVLLQGSVHLRVGSGRDHYVGQYDRWVNDMCIYGNYIWSYTPDIFRLEILECVKNFISLQSCDLLHGRLALLPPTNEVAGR